MHEGVRQVGSRLRAEVEGRLFYLNAGEPTGVGCGRGVGLAVLHCSGCSVCCIYSGLGGIQVGLFLKLADIFLVPDPFVAEPVGYLCEHSRRRRRSRGVRRQGATAPCTEQCDCFKMSCLGPSSTQFPAPAVMSAGYTS